MAVVADDVAATTADEPSDTEALSDPALVAPPA
jgi:hypothetical protein